MKLPYQEGSIFVLPLKWGRYARGVVARKSPKGKVLFGYFFGPPLRSIRSVPVDDLDPSNAILRVRFGDLGLVNGEWRVIGAIQAWDRALWPMPTFVRRDPLGKIKPIIVAYSDMDPLRLESEHSVEHNPGLDPNTLYGYGSVETTLTKLLKAEH